MNIHLVFTLGEKSKHYGNELPILRRKFVRSSLITIDIRNDCFPDGGMNLAGNTDALLEKRFLKLSEEAIIPPH